MTESVPDVGPSHAQTNPSGERRVPMTQIEERPDEPSGLHTLLILLHTRDRKRRIYKTILAEVLLEEVTQNGGTMYRPIKK